MGSRGKFWMVLGMGTPNYRHPSRQSAKTEAERLAKSNPGEEFTVLESVATAVTHSIVWERNDIDGSVGDSDVPF